MLPLEQGKPPRRELMSQPTSSKQARSARVAALGSASQGWWPRLGQTLRLGRFWLRTIPALLAAVVVWWGLRPWYPPLPHRLGEVPSHDLVARVRFSVSDPRGTEQARNLARQSTPRAYRNQAQPLVHLRQELLHKLRQLADANSWEEVPVTLWNEFQLHPQARPQEAPTREQQEERFEQFRQQLLQAAQKAGSLEKALAAALQPLERQGLLHSLQHQGANRSEVYVLDAQGTRQRVPVSLVLIGQQSQEGSWLHRQLKSDPALGPLGDALFAFLRHRLVETLSLDRAETLRLEQAAARQVQPKVVHYQPGQLLAPALQPLTEQNLELLRTEHRAWVAQLRKQGAIWPRIVGLLGCVLGVLVLVAGYAVRRCPGLWKTWSRYLAFLAVVALAIPAAVYLYADPWRAELVPVLVAVVIATLTFGRQFGLIVALSCSALIMLGLATSTGELLLLLGVTGTVVLLLGQVRSRMRLLQISLVAAVVAVVITLLVAVVEYAPLDRFLLTRAMHAALAPLAAGFLLTGLLPLIERTFDVLTDLKLLELGDNSHPLLQQLVQRAPGTYNHSIHVAALAEAAAESVGARGLLVRVGAYFHDVGKMVEPKYFIENQQRGTPNCHDSLAPKVSTLAIIAHVRDGVELAQQYGLPEPIIDLIRQHHGTTLVRFFYDRACRRAKEGEETVLEEEYRYPGPKPQTREAAILMLADAVESSSRTLKDPTPAQLATLVETIAAEKLQDGQFDECDLTLRQLDIIKASLVKALVAMYHGRVKYPGQEPETPPRQEPPRATPAAAETPDESLPAEPPADSPSGSAADPTPSLVRSQKA